MSFDIFVQGFRDGDSRDPDPVAFAAALAPYLDAKREHLIVGDASADIYVGSRGFMVNRIGGPAIYDVLVKIADACDVVIIPVGVPVALAHEEQRRHLPDEISAGAVVIRTGAELLHLIVSS